MSLLDYTTDSIGTRLDHLSPSPVGCGCGCDADGLVGLERTRFFPRQLVGPDDLTQDQAYFLGKARRHNRLLHGWGVVCGARVKPGAAQHEVVVEPGYVLGPYGDEIVIDREVTIDIRLGRAAGSECDPVDPWCSEVPAQAAGEETRYLAVRHVERPARPVLVPGCGCGCDDTACEHSRIRDGYEVELLSELPEPYIRLDGQNPLYDVIQLFRAFACLDGPRACPPCPTSPWVVLADVSLAGEKVAIDCAAHRRHVVSFAEFSFRCGAAKLGGLGLLMGTTKSMMVDAQHLETAPGEATAPVASVAVKRVDGGWTSVPASFSVEPGETIRSLLAREGDRELIDTGTGESVKLRELYAAAGADPDRTVATASEALAPLEAATLDVSGLRIVRSTLEELVDRKGIELLDDRHGGSPAAAAEIPATALRGVEDESAVGKHLEGLTVAEVAVTPKAEFVTAAIRGLKGAARVEEQAHAEEVWATAERVARLSGAWGG